MSTFICPLCGGRNYGLETRTDGTGTRYWACHGCPWTCAEDAALDSGIATSREEMLRAAVGAVSVATELSVRADDPQINRKVLEDSAERLEKIAHLLRIISSYELDQEQAAARAIERSLAAGKADS